MHYSDVLFRMIIFKNAFLGQTLTGIPLPGPVLDHTPLVISADNMTSLPVPGTDNTSLCLPAREFTSFPIHASSAIVNNVKVPFPVTNAGCLLDNPLQYFSSLSYNPLL